MGDIGTQLAPLWPLLLAALEAAHLVFQVAPQQVPQEHLVKDLKAATLQLLVLAERLAVEEDQAQLVKTQFLQALMALAALVQRRQLLGHL